MVRRSVSVGVQAVYGRSLSDPKLAGRGGEARHSFCFVFFYICKTTLARVQTALAKHSKLASVESERMEGGGGAHMALQETKCARRRFFILDISATV